LLPAKLFEIVILLQSYFFGDHSVIFFLNIAVLELIEFNPFPKEPPKYIRAQLYHYHFTTTNARYVLQQ